MTNDECQRQACEDLAHAQANARWMHIAVFVTPDGQLQYRRTQCNFLTADLPYVMRKLEEDFEDIKANAPLETALVPLPEAAGFGVVSADGQDEHSERDAGV